MKSLEELVEQDLPDEEALGEVAVDVSQFYGQPEGTTVFTYKEPDIAQTFQIPVDAQKLLKLCPAWPENLRMTVAMLAMGHHTPAAKEAAVARMYVRLAQKSKKMFTYLSSQFNAAFPHLMGDRAALDEEKKSSGSEAELSLSSVCATPDASPAS